MVTTGTCAGFAYSLCIKFVNYIVLNTYFLGSILFKQICYFGGCQKESFVEERTISPHMFQSIMIGLTFQNQYFRPAFLFGATECTTIIQLIRFLMSRSSFLISTNLSSIPRDLPPSLLTSVNRFFAPAMVKRSSYKSLLICINCSTSCLRYKRWSDRVRIGRTVLNSDSQYLTTYGSTPSIRPTSPIRK